MSKIAAAYTEGMADAYSAFGVRIASANLAHRKMPEGPMHLGAERLAKALSSQANDFGFGPDKRLRNLEKPVRFGPPASLESSNQLSVGGLPGVGDPGGV